MMQFIDRLEYLLEKHGLTAKQFLKDMQFGANQLFNWRKLGAVPNRSTLFAISKYFDVSIEYLLGEEDDDDLAEQEKNSVINWLKNNFFTVKKGPDDTVVIGKHNSHICFSSAEFSAQCHVIKKSSRDGFALAMSDWVRKNFYEANFSSHLQNYSNNAINRSPNSTLQIGTKPEATMSKQTLEFAKIFEGLSIEKQYKLLGYAFKLRDEK